MALTRPKIGQLQTSTAAAISDPITVLHQGATSANVDVGFLFNRANGLVSNVALYWNETGNSFVTAFTSNTGVTDSNITVTSYASLITGGITASGNIIQTGTGYHTIPVGNTAQRPGTATSGMIRYNTTLSSFEGYGSAWSSLGGVKSVDGNTYILAEASVGAGDNILWFYNNATNTAKLSTSNLTLSQTTTSTSTTTGALIVGGGAGIAGNVVAPNFYGNISPTPGLSTVYTTGHIVPTANVTYDLGTPTLRYRSLYLSGSTIYLGNATITTTSTGDIIINNTGSFAVPVGTTDQRSAIQGAIRYNTTISAFESYDGTTWNKLAYGTVSDFPVGDYGDLNSTATDAFGAKTATTTDCNSDGSLVTTDLASAGTAALEPI